MRRYARLSNGVRRKLASHAAATALNCFSYNFIRIHRTLRTSPAMAAGVADRLWSVEDLAVLWETYEQRRAERARRMNLWVIPAAALILSLYLWTPRTSKGALIYCAIVAAALILFFATRR